MTSQHRFLEQLGRVKRWYARMKGLDFGKSHMMPSDYYEDEVYSFFLNCYHLKDWLKNDESVDLSVREKVEEFVNKNDCLLICADLCNSSKHLRLDSARSDQEPKFGKKHIDVLIDAGDSCPPVIRIKYSIQTKVGKIDAFELASECLEKWEEFIKANVIS